LWLRDTQRYDLKVSVISYYFCTLYKHLSKCPSALKQNGTQEKKPFLGVVFPALSHGVIRFVALDCYFSNRRPYLAVEEFQPVRRWFLELTLATKWTSQRM